jgi:hypothetical protein
MRHSNVRPRRQRRVRTRLARNELRRLLAAGRRHPTRRRHAPHPRGYRGEIQTRRRRRRHPRPRTHRETLARPGGPICKPLSPVRGTKVSGEMTGSISVWKESFNFAAGCVLDYLAIQRGRFVCARYGASASATAAPGPNFSTTSKRSVVRTTRSISGSMWPCARRKWVATART